MRKNNDTASQELYAAWHAAELHALQVFDEVNEDYAHPRYIEANDQAHAILLELLKPSTSLHGALVKLKIASYCEGYIKDVEDPECTVIAPRAIISAINDLEAIIGNQSAACPR